jgi:diguanylate cyclase (GGDEF)-like protein
VKVDVFLETSLARDFQKQADFLLYGMLFGILAAMLLYSLTLFISLKDKSYLFYSLYTLSAGLWLFFLHGFSKALFGQNPGTDQRMLWFWVGLMLAWGSVFVAHFLRLKDGMAAMNRLILALGALGLVVSFAGLLGWYDIAFSLSHYLGILIPILGTVTALIRFIQGFPSSFFFFIAWIFLGAGGLVFALMGLKLLPVNFFTINSSAIGVALQSVLLSVALSDRFRRLESETERLEKIQADYEALNLTDESTGLPNKRFLMAELDDLMEKARQKRAPLSLLMIDVDNFGSLNDTLDGAKPEDVLAGLASIAKASTRGSDRVCSLGGDRLAVILPGTGAQPALNAAERIRERFASEGYRGEDSRGHASESLAITLSIGVAELSKEDSRDSLLDRSDKAVQEAKTKGKNRSIYIRSVE